MSDVKYITPLDYLVARKDVQGGTIVHSVKLFYYPIEYDSRYQNEKIVKRKPEWWVEVDLGAFYKECFYENEKSARLAFELINVNFVSSVTVWHAMRKEADKYRLKTLAILQKKIFVGKGSQSNPSVMGDKKDG